jgi:UTP:GlnB (protein PII) uridylyltransferase
VRSDVDSAAPFVPAGPVHIDVEQVGAGLSQVSVAAPDGIGLLWAISTWFEHHGCNILVARATPQGEFAEDTFLVDGIPDALELSRHLSGAAVPAG